MMILSSEAVYDHPDYKLLFYQSTFCLNKTLHALPLPFLHYFMQPVTDKRR